MADPVQEFDDDFSDVPYDLSVPGAFVDSGSRAWADLPTINTAGEITQGRRQLTDEEALMRMAAGVDLDAVLASEPTMDEAIGPASVRPTQLDMVTGYGQELSAEEQAILDRMSQARSVTTARDNPQRATEEQYARMWEGDPRGLPVQQFDREAALASFQPPPREEWETDEEYNARAIAARDDHFARVDGLELAHMIGMEGEIQDAATSLDPFALGTPGHMGIADAQLVAEGNVGAATMDRQSQSAALQIQAAKETQQAVADVAAWEEQQRQHAADVLAATEQLRATEAEARTQLASLPISDRRNFFKSMSGGQKLWAMIGALATGWNGSDMIPRMVMQMADQQFEEERARIDRASLVQQTTSRAIDQGMDVYNTIARGVTDQATQKLMYVKLQHEQAMQVLEAEWAAATVPVIKAQLEQTLVNMRGQQAEIEHQIGTRLNQTPGQFISTQTLYPGGPDQKRRDEKALEKLGERKHAVAMKGLDVAGDMEGREAAADLKRIEAEGKAAEKRAEAEAKGAEDVLKNSKEWGTLEQMIDDFLAAHPDDIHGVGIPLTGSKGERISVDSFRTLLPQMAIKAITGANFSPEQGEAANALVKGDWDEFGDEDFRARLRALKNLASAQRRYLQSTLENRGASTKTAAPILESTRGLSTFKPE